MASTRKPPLATGDRVTASRRFGPSGAGVVVGKGPRPATLRVRLDGDVGMRTYPSQGVRRSA